MRYHPALSTWRNTSYTRLYLKFMIRVLLDIVYIPRFHYHLNGRGTPYLYRSINLSRRITACIFHASIFPWQVAGVSAFSRGTRRHLLRYTATADKLTSLPEATAGQLCTQPASVRLARAIARARARYCFLSGNLVREFTTDARVNMHRSPSAKLGHLKLRPGTYRDGGG